MAIRNKQAVENYARTVAEIQAALANMAEFAQSLPAPDENDQVPNMHYGHLGTLEHIRELLGQASTAMDGFWK